MRCGLFRNFDFVGKGSIGMKCCDPEKKLIVNERQTQIVNDNHLKTADGSRHSYAHEKEFQRVIWLCECFCSLSVSNTENKKHSDCMHYAWAIQQVMIPGEM